MAKAGRGSLAFLVPSHLDVLQNFLVRGARFVAEVFELADHLMKLGKTELERILIWKLVPQRPGDLFVVLPGELHDFYDGAGNLCRRERLRQDDGGSATMRSASGA